MGILIGAASIVSLVGVLGLAQAMLWLSSPSGTTYAQGLMSGFDADYRQWNSDDTVKLPPLNPEAAANYDQASDQSANQPIVPVAILPAGGGPLAPTYVTGVTAVAIVPPDPKEQPSPDPFILSPTVEGAEVPITGETLPLIDTPTPNQEFPPTPTDDPFIEAPPEPTLAPFPTPEPVTPEPDLYPTPYATWGPPDELPPTDEPTVEPDRPWPTSSWATSTPWPTETPWPTQTPTPSPTDTPWPTETPLPTETPTETPAPTETPMPTETPTPTNTRTPTITPGGPTLTPTRTPTTGPT